jgi:hypothetical protein
MLANKIESLEMSESGVRGLAHVRSRGSKAWICFCFLFVFVLFCFFCLVSFCFFLFFFCFF